MNGKKFNEAVFTAAIFAGAAGFIAFPSEAAEAVRGAVKNCLEIIVPSLFALMVLSDMYIKSGLYRRTGRAARFIAAKIFKISPEMAPVPIVGAVSGYPVGAALITAAVKDGAVDEKEAERLLCQCFGAGPAFIYGAVGVGVFGSPRAGTAIFLSCIAANLIIGIFLGAGEKAPTSSGKAAEINFSSRLFCESVENGGKSILKMCGIIIFVSAALAVPEAMGITEAAADALGGALSADPYYIYTALRSAAEISNIAYLKTDSLAMLPTAAALISFGGISVFMQVMSVCSGTVRTGKLIISRFYAAALSYIICTFLGKLLCGNGAVQTMTGIKEIRHNSPIPTAFLLIMTILLLSQKNVVKIKKM